MWPRAFVSSLYLIHRRRQRGVIAPVGGGLAPPPNKIRARSITTQTRTQVVEKVGYILVGTGIARARKRTTWGGGGGSGGMLPLENLVS